MGEQIELNLKRKSRIPIEYQFSQDYLKGVVRKEIAQIIGNADQLAKDLDVPDIQKEIKDVLSMRGLEVNFQKDRVVIMIGEKDDTGEYWKDYAVG